VNCEVLAQAPAPRRDTLTVDLHGVSLELRSSETDFNDYAGRALAALGPASQRRPAILSRLEWLNGQPPRDLRAAFGSSDWERRLDRDLYFGGHTAYWLRIDDFTDLQMQITWSEGRLEVTGRYYFQIGKSQQWESLRRLRHWHRHDVLRARRFSTLVYYLVFHPLLWWLSRFEGWHVLHAAAVARNGHAHVFAGLPGCGKSTLAVGALALPGVEMLSDNLLLTDGRRVRACPELLLLDEGSVVRVGTACSRLAKVGDRRVYERDSYRADSIRLDALEPQTISVVHRSRRPEMRPLDPALAVDRIEAGNVLAKEVRRYRIMAQVLDLLAKTRTPDERAILCSLTRQAPCFEGGVTADEAPQDALARLMDDTR